VTDHCVFMSYERGRAKLEDVPSLDFMGIDQLWF